MISQVRWLSFRRFAACQSNGFLIFPNPGFMAWRWGVAHAPSWPSIMPLIPGTYSNPSQNCFRKQIFVLKFDLFVNLFVMNFPFAWLPALELKESGIRGIGELVLNCLCLAFAFPSLPHLFS